MKFSENQGLLKKFRSAAWKFQQTFQTPLNDLNRFTSTIITAAGPLKTGTVAIDLVVFDPDTYSTCRLAIRFRATINAVLPSRLRECWKLRNSLARYWPTGSISSSFLIPSPSPFLQITMNSQPSMPRPAMPRPGRILIVSFILSLTVGLSRFKIIREL